MAGYDPEARHGRRGEGNIDHRARSRRARPIGQLALLAPLACVVGLGSGCLGLPGSEPPGSQPSDAEVLAQTEETLAALTRMSEFLASRPALRFEADIHYDAIQPSGQRIEFGSERRFAMRRPDRARVQVAHWDGDEEVVTFDGRRLSATIPEQRIYASTTFEGTAAEAFDHLVAEYGAASPLSDLLRRDLPDEIADRAKSARHLGTVMIAGTPCDHLAFRGADVDFQLFVRQGDEPVPVRVAIDYRSEEGRPQFRARLHSWELSPELPDSLFRLAPPAGSQRVPFSELLDLLLGPLTPEPDDS